MNHETADGDKALALRVYALSGIATSDHAIHWRVESTHHGRLTLAARQIYQAIVASHR